MLLDVVGSCWMSVVPLLDVVGVGCCWMLLDVVVPLLDVVGCCCSCNATGGCCSSHC